MDHIGNWPATSRHPLAFGSAGGPAFYPSSLDRMLEELRFSTVQHPGQD
jgi:hypothetical protein